MFQAGKALQSVRLGVAPLVGAQGGKQVTNEMVKNAVCWVVT